MTRQCLVCAKPLPVKTREQCKAGGRRRLYCSNPCRQLAYRYRSDPELAEILNLLARGRLQHLPKGNLMTDHKNEIQLQGRRVFEATITRAKVLITRGVAPGAVVAGLLAVVTEIASETVGPRETRRLLMMAADSHNDANDGAALQ